MVTGMEAESQYSIGRLKVTKVKIKGESLSGSGPGVRTIGLTWQGVKRINRHYRMQSEDCKRVLRKAILNVRLNISTKGRRYRMIITYTLKVNIDKWIKKGKGKPKKKRGVISNEKDRAVIRGGV